MTNNTDENEDNETQILVGSYTHEILNICVKRNMKLFDFVHPLISCLKSDDVEIKLSVLYKLGESVNILNKYFKHQIVGELWEMELFSLKEALTEPDVERAANMLYEITLGIVSLE